MEATDPNDWDEMWGWIDGAWQRVRRSYIGDRFGCLTVESFRAPGKLYMLPIEHLRRGEQPTEPPPPAPAYMGIEATPGTDAR